ADAAAFAVVAGERMTERNDDASALQPSDAADAVALAGATALLDTLAIAAGETPRATTASESIYAALLRHRDGSVRLPMVALTLRKVLDGKEPADALTASLDLYCARGPRFEATILQALAQRRTSGTPAVRKAALPEPLTQREHEVLTLLAAGLTNKEIAERLIVSPRTIETHVERVLGKLAVGSRTRAIAKAIRLDLVALQDLA
ncbi:MAG TPA: response regulator transcription factor, partial [Candidatus Baltobacteraceae bacterium]